MPGSITSINILWPRKTLGGIQGNALLETKPRGTMRGVLETEAKQREKWWETERECAKKKQHITLKPSQQNLPSLDFPVWCYVLQYSSNNFYSFIVNALSVIYTLSVVQALNHSPQLFKSQRSRGGGIIQEPYLKGRSTALRFGARGLEGFLLRSVVSPCKEIRTGFRAPWELRKVVSSPESRKSYRKRPHSLQCTHPGSQLCPWESLTVNAACR